MSRRSGQSGYVEKKGNAYYVRYWCDVFGQEKRAHKSVRICPATGPGKLNKSQREHKGKEIIIASGADTAEHFQQVQAANLGTTFQQQADWWLRHIQVRKRRPVKPQTARNWQSYLRWIQQRIGNMRLGSVNNSTLRDLVSEMAQVGFASGTIKGYVQVVKMVIASAIRDDGEPIYPRKWNHEFIDLPLVRAERTTCFTSEQVNRIVAANGPYHVLYALLAGSGMRIGEALGLEISDVSADGQTIRIRQSVWNGRVQAPKTLSSLREIDLHPSLAGLLLDYIGLRRNGFVFQTSRGTALQVTHVLCRGLHPVLAGLGEVQTGFHAFRRFRVTHLRKQGIPEDLLRFWIGHGDKTITDGYSKVKHDAEFRRAVANSIPLGFELPAGKPPFVPNVPKQEFLLQAVNA